MNRLALDIESFLRTGRGDFQALALALFAYQFEKNRPYQAFCRLQSVTPGGIRRWQDIPAVPMSAFKSAELATFPVAQAAAQFQSSGTTGHVKSRHFLKTLSFYESSLKTSFLKTSWQDPVKRPFLILTPSPAEAPHSSLSWMMDVIKRTYGAPGSDYFVQRGRLDEPRLSRRLTQAQASGIPVALLGTTISFLAFFDYANHAHASYALSAGSWLMDTGGMKSEKRQSTRLEFVRKVEAVLGIPESACVNEYGMCELGSQFYGHGANSYLEGPAWTRTLAMDPVTGQPSSSGKPGLLRHFDLANVDSVLAVQTEDVGVIDGNGFVLQGRDPGAEVKGCSLAAEAFLS